MANNISSILNNKLRFSGLASGLDTDSMIKQLMKVESMKVDKVKQDRQLLVWKRDNYRDVTNLIRGFKDSYFDVLKPEKNFRSLSAFATYDVKSLDEAIVTAKAGVGAASTSHQITVRKLATAAKIEDTTPGFHITSAVQGSADITDFDLLGKQMVINYDGVSKVIALDNYSGADDAAKMTDMEAKLQTAIDNAIGTGKVDVIANGLKLEFSSLVSGSTFALSEYPNTFVNSLGFADTQKNYMTGSDITLTDLSGANGKIRVTYGALSKDIDIAGLTATSTLEDLRATLQTALNDNTNGFGDGSFSVKLNGTKLEVISNTGAAASISDGSSSDVSTQLGFKDGASASAVSAGMIDMSTNEQGKTFIVSINGTDHEIEMDQNYADASTMATYIEGQLGGAVDVTAVSGRLFFSSATGEKIEFKKGLENSLEKLGFTPDDNRGNRISLNSNLNSIEQHFTTPAAFDENANVSFAINGVTIDLKKKFSEATIQDVMSAVNGSSANVELRYDSLNDKFSLASKTTGVAATISITDTDPTNGLFKALGIDVADLTAGQDAEFDLDGVTGMKRSSNEFNINGVTYSLKSVPDPIKTVSISVNANADDLVEKVKEFVSKYNEMIDKINTEYSEKRDKDYAPLTDAQKEAMSEDDIKKWEEKAQAGILRGDSILGKILSDMRRALYDEVDGTSTSLYKIGITTGTYEQKGKLVINETKLKAAINGNIDAVAQLFTKSSEVSYQDALTDSTKQKTRYNQSGIGQRLFDIIQDNIRSTRDGNGAKGTLLEKAGITGDISEFKNLMSEEISDKDTLVDVLLDKLVDKEDALYKKFTAMEKALSMMNSQSSWMAQQFGGSQ